MLIQSELICSGLLHRAAFLRTCRTSIAALLVVSSREGAWRIQNLLGVWHSLIGGVGQRSTIVNTYSGEITLDGAYEAVAG